MIDTFLFYDYETFGLNPALDKPAQFASVRTNLNFKTIEDPSVFYCYPPKDYLPDPKSILITGITPEYTIKHGFNESLFSKKIYSILNKTRSCIVGFNNVKFDDEFTRNIFYRNLLDIYSWQWKNGNSRLDVIKIIRACYVFRPNEISWPKKKDGSISFKLEDLAKVNGINHYRSHDALSDVYATISLLKLVKYKYPKMLNFFFKIRKKNGLLDVIKKSRSKLFIYTSSFFGFKQYYCICFFPIVIDPNNKNLLIYINVGGEDVEKNFIKNRFSLIKNNNVEYFFSFGFSYLYMNRCEIIAPITILQKNDFFRLNLNKKTILNNRKWIKKNYFLLKEAALLFLSKCSFQINKDEKNVDLLMYRSFLSNSDKLILERVHVLPKKNWNVLKFKDNRMNKVFYRYRARNYFYLLNRKEKEKWIYYCSSIINQKKLYEYIVRVKYLLKKYSYDIKKINLLKNMLLYAKKIYIEHRLNLFFIK
ncbi:Exodeoxyribonuclease I [Buchnera aphidicola (Anoecia corni)]|uniref:Exodeoxyribonuclease I n=1 Tax=Buchnera aphidicola (Anoecia corni) TaxID=2994477 RepID=A0AAT9IGM5_9GAMM